MLWWAYKRRVKSRSPCCTLKVNLVTQTYTLFKKRRGLEKRPKELSGHVPPVCESTSATVWKTAVPMGRVSRQTEPLHSPSTPLDTLPSCIHQPSITLYSSSTSIMFFVANALPLDTCVTYPQPVSHLITPYLQSEETPTRIWCLIQQIRKSSDMKDPNEALIPLPL